MGTGEVDFNWAKEHLWLEDDLAKGGTAGHPEVSSATPGRMNATRASRCAVPRDQGSPCGRSRPRSID